MVVVVVPIAGGGVVTAVVGCVLNDSSRKRPATVPAIGEDCSAHGSSSELERLVVDVAARHARGAQGSVTAPVMPSGPQTKTSCLRVPGRSPPARAAESGSPPSSLRRPVTIRERAPRCSGEQRELAPNTTSSSRLAR